MAKYLTERFQLEWKKKYGTEADLTDEGLPPDYALDDEFPFSAPNDWFRAFLRYHRNEQDDMEFQLDDANNEGEYIHYHTCDGPKRLQEDPIHRYLDGHRFKILPGNFHHLVGAAPWTASDAFAEKPLVCKFVLCFDISLGYHDENASFMNAKEWLFPDEFQWLQSQNEPPATKRIYIKKRVPLDDEDKVANKIPCTYSSFVRFLSKLLFFSNRSSSDQLGICNAKKTFAVGHLFCALGRFQGCYVARSD